MCVDVDAVVVVVAVEEVVSANASLVVVVVDVVMGLPSIKFFTLSFTSSTREFNSGFCVTSCNTSFSLSGSILLFSSNPKKVNNYHSTPNIPSLYLSAHTYFI